MINGVPDEKSTFPKNICKHLWDRRLATHVDKNEMFRCVWLWGTRTPTEWKIL